MKTSSDPPSSEITPESVYFNRRNFMKAGRARGQYGGDGPGLPPAQFAIDNRPLTPRRSTSSRPRRRPTRASARTKPRPPSRISRTTTTSTSFPRIRTTSPRRRRTSRPPVGRSRSAGWCSKPRVFDLDDLLKIAAGGRAGLPYAMRGGVVDGDPLGRLFAFATTRSRRTPGQRQVRSHADAARSRANARTEDARLEWPYVEGLRLDEAMHPLTILASGLYGRALPPQDGARCDWSCRGNTGSRESSRL